MIGFRQRRRNVGIRRARSCRLGLEPLEPRLALDAAPVLGELAGATGHPLQDFLRVTELHYNPAAPSPSEETQGFSNNDAFEFLELANLGDETLDLGGVRFTEGIVFSFAGADVTTLAPGERLVLVADRTAFEARYGSSVNVAGSYGPDDTLQNSGDHLVLVDQFGVTIQDFSYNDSGSWPGRADGCGASLVIRDTEGDCNDPANWRSSTEYGGSPGEAGLGAIADVLINEVLSHTDPPQVDAIELVNVTDAPIDLGGWYLSDSFENFLKYEIPAGTILPAGGYLVFDEYDFNWSAGVDPNDFALNSFHGDDVWLMATDAGGNLTRFVDHVAVPATANGESFGRWPDADGGLYPMRSLTFGAANSGPRVGPVVISELHYNPGDDPELGTLEFVEIYNPTAEEVDLTEWWLCKGIDFSFAPGTRLGALSTLVVVPFDPAADPVARAAFEDYYQTAESLVLLGPYSGRLSNGGEEVQLQRPDEPPVEEPDFFPRLLEDEAAYDDEAPWPTSADGLGDSLTRVSPDAWGHDAGSWTARTPSPGSVAFDLVGGTITLVVRPDDAAMVGNSRGESDALPESLTWVDEWTRFWVEIWGKTASDGAAVAGFSVDLEYNTTAFSAVSVEFGPAMTDGQSQDIQDALGRVDAIAASTGEENLGGDQYVLLARVRFEPTDDDAGIAHNAAAGYVAPVDALQLAVGAGRMELQILGWTSTDASVPPIDAWPVMYDYDNDEVIGLGDLSYFASAYGKAADDPGSPYGRASDFDHTGHVDLGDLSYFAANYRRTRSIGDVVYPYDFPESWLPAETAAANPGEFAPVSAQEAAAHDTGLAEASERQPPRPLLPSRRVALRDLAEAAAVESARAKRREPQPHGPQKLAVDRVLAEYGE